MHLKDIFDMMAGTSAGSMNAAGLSIPSESNKSEPKFFAFEMQEVF
jgi:patatin-like phospholipase/acyl hydrolase